MVLAVFLVQMYGKAYRDSGYDFTSYLLSAKALLQGENPFKTDTSFTYSYPLFLAFILIPLTFVPYWLANLLWFGIGVTSLLGAIVVLVRPITTQINTRWGSHIFPVIALTLFLFIGVIQNNLLNGQANALVLLLCALFLKFHQEGKALPSSLCLAAAAAIKLVPLIFLVMLLVRRDIRTMILSLLFFVGFCLAPIIFLGSDGLRIYQEYVQGFVLAKFAGGAAVTVHRTYFTLQGFISQMIPSAAAWPGLGILCLVFVTAAVAVTDMLATRRLGARAAWWTFHLYLLAILLITPLSEKHHLVYLIPVVSLLVVKAVYDLAQPIRDLVLRLAFFLASFYIGWTFGGPFYFFSIITLFATISRVVTEEPE